MPGVAEQLVGKSAKERARLKSQAIFGVVQAEVRKGGPGSGWTFLGADGSVVNVSEVVLGIFTSRTGSVVPGLGLDPVPVWMRVTVNGVYRNGDGWYGFYNPPILVADGTTTTVTLWDGAASYEKPNFKEDLLVAAQRMVADAVGVQL